MSTSETPLLRGSPRRVRKPGKRRGLPAAPRIETPALPVEDGPFLRSRQRPRVARVRRSGAGRAVLAMQALAALLLLLAGTAAAWRQVMRSERLKVKTVDVRGNHFLSEGELRELLGPADGANILALDIEDLKHRLRASPWLEDATVRRTLPDTLVVEVREREPLALAELDRLYLMDGDGDLIDLYGGRTAVYDLPVVRGLAGLSDDARRERARRVATLLADLGELQKELSEIEVLPENELRVVLRRGGEIVRLAAPPYRQGLQAFLDLRRELVLRVPHAEYFDLRFRGRIYAKEAVAGAPSGTPGEPDLLRR